MQNGSIELLEKELVEKMKKLREPQVANANRKVPVNLVQEVATIKRTIKALKQQELKFKKKRRILV